MSVYLRRFSRLLIILTLSVRSTAAAEPTAHEARVSLIHNLQIPAKEAGVLVELLVREGSQVKAGQVLGRIDPSLVTLEADAAALQSQIASLQSENDVNLRFARKSSQVSLAEFQRFQEAVQTYAKSVSQSELEEARLVAERSEMAIQQAEIELRAARLTSDLRMSQSDIALKHVENLEIKSPISGTIVEVFRQPGEWAQVGQPLVRIIDLKKLRVEAFLNEDDGRDSIVGKPVVFTTNNAGTSEQDYDGAIVFVSPEISAVTGQVRVWAEVDNENGLLRPGAKGRLIIRD